MNSAWSESDRQRDVEAMIRAAGDYVEVSTDLRPRTLEAAYQLHRDEQLRHRVTILVLAAMLVVAPLDHWFSTPIVQRTWSNHRTEKLSPLASRYWLERGETGDIIEAVLE